MSCSAEFVQYIVDQCSGAGNIRVQKMFGDYGIYLDDKIFGLICDDQFFVKITEAGKKRMPGLEKAAPYEGAKEQFLISDVDDREKLADFVRVTCEELPAPKPKKKRKK